jgi:serine/threonine protein kinase
VALMRCCIVRRFPSNCVMTGAGEVMWPRCTLAYAAPDVVAAVHDNRDITISAAQGMWALGVMAFEALMGTVTLRSRTDVFDCALGRSRFPWEAPESEQPLTWQQSRLRGLLMPCLARDPTRRPTDASLLVCIQRFGNATAVEQADSRASSGALQQRHPSER